MTSMIERLLLPIIECPPFLPPSYQEGGEEREIAEEERRYARYVGAIMQSKGGRGRGRNIEDDDDDDDDDDEEYEEGEEGEDDVGRGVGDNDANGSPQKKKKKKSVGNVMLERKMAEAEEQMKRDLVECFQEELRPPPLRKSLGNDGSLDRSINNVSMIDDASMDM